MVSINNYRKEIIELMRWLFLDENNEADVLIQKLKETKSN